MEVLGIILGLIVFTIVLAFTIGIHEWAHMFTAKKLGIAVPKFFIGFGKTLWSKQRKGTEYGLKVFPLGGYVTISDEKTEGIEEIDRLSLSYVKPWRRTLIYIAGAVMNIIVGFALLWVSMFFVNYTDFVPEITKLHCPSNSYCAAKSYGLKPGDTITKVNGKDVLGRLQLLDDIQGAKTATITFERKEGGKVVTKTIENMRLSEGGRIGVIFSKQKPLPLSLSYVNANYRKNVSNVVNSMAKIPTAFVNTFKDFGVNIKDAKRDRMGSIVSLGQQYATVTTDTLENKDNSDTPLKSYLFYVFYITSIINISIGVLNLFPILPLDGGHVMIAFFDAIRQKINRVRKKPFTPFPKKVTAILNLIMGAFLISVFTVAIFSDVVSLII